MPSPLVSVLIPAFNAGPYIELALGSVLAQSYPHLEIIVVNDGSTDDTSDRLASFSDDNIKIIHQENLGQCAAANRALREASGEYIKFFDADDFMSPQMIELQLQALSGSTKHIASAEWGRFYDHDPQSAHFHPERCWQNMDPVDWIVSAFTDGGRMMQCGIWLIPHEILKSTGGWNEKLGLINDYEFMFRVILATEGVRFTPGARLHYRTGVAGSLSGTFSEAAANSAFESLTLGTEHLLAAEDSERTRSMSADIYQHWAYNFYPQHPALAKSAEARTQELGGSREKLPGGLFINIFSKLFGWKAAIRFRQFAHRAGWAKIARLRWRKSQG